MKVTESVITAVYFAFCIGVGIYYNKKSSSDLSEYYTAGRGVGMTLSVLAAFSAFASGGTILGAVGLGYRYGIAYTWSNNIGSVCGFILAAVLVAPHLRKMRLTTVTDFFNVRYQWKAVTILCGVIITGSFTAYLISQFKAAAITGQFLMGWSYGVTLFLVAVVFILYVSIGGMWAVTMTDAFQAVLMLITMAFLSITAIVHNGGPATLLQDAISVSPMYAVNSRGAVPLIGCAVLWTFAICCEPHVVMRMLSSRTNRVARMTMGYAAILFALFALGFFGVSAAAVKMFPPDGATALADSDMAFLSVMSHYFPAALRGLSAAAVMAAIMSTTDGILLAISASFSKDIIHNLKPNLSEQAIMRVGFYSVWILGAVSSAFAINPPALLTIFYSNAVGMFAAGFFAPLVLGIWWKKANKYGALCSFIFGSGGFFILALVKQVGFFTAIPLFGEFVICLPLGFVAMIVGSLATEHKLASSGYEVMEPIHAGAKLI